MALKLFDVPLPLGEHLDELRRRLIVPVIAVVVIFMVAFACDHQLKLLMVRPLQSALHMVSAETLANVKLDKDSPRLLDPKQLGESAMVSMNLSFYAAIAVAIPVIVWQLWGFVAVGLKAKERRLAFLFVPLGIILFYLGALAGYFFGLPYFYAWLIDWQGADPIARSYALTESGYLDNFVTMTICFGLIMDIPWLVMVLCRVGFVSPDQFARWRKIVIMINVVLAAAITPTSDPISLMALFIPMQLLFESGLLASRIMMRSHRKQPTEPSHGR